MHWYFKISFISFINTIFPGQRSRRIKPQTLTLIPLNLFQKIEPKLTIQSAMYLRGVSFGILLVPHRTTRFFMDDGKSKMLTMEHFSRDLLQYLSLKHLSGLNTHSIYLGIYLGLLRWSLLVEVLGFESLIIKDFYDDIQPS